VAFIGSQWTVTDAGSWYQSIEMPSWNPPGWVFGPVWTLLYIAMAVAAWLVWLKERDGRAVGVPLTVWAVQLLLNLSWTYVFFERQSIAGGVVVIALLWLAIVATIAVFRRCSRPAGWLLAPYLAWVTFAAALNVAIWRLN
jgi:tryptophan-rich sensory protein